jgi:hypothetical protein
MAYRETVYGIPRRAPETDGLYSGQAKDAGYSQQSVEGSLEECVYSLRSHYLCCSNDAGARSRSLTMPLGYDQGAKIVCDHCRG